MELLAILRFSEAYGQWPPTATLMSTLTGVCGKDNTHNEGLHVICMTIKINSHSYDL